MSFQKNTILVALAILAIFLFIVGLMLWRGQKNTSFPPSEAQCPDYHIVVGDGWCKPQSDNLGTLFQENGEKYQASAFMTKEAGKQGACMLMNSGGVVWDGITNVGPCESLKV